MTRVEAQLVTGMMLSRVFETEGDAVVTRKEINAIAYLLEEYLAMRGRLQCLEETWLARQERP